MTFKILTDKSNKIIHRSNVRPTYVPLDKKIRLEPLTVPCVVKSKGELSDDTDLVQNTKIRAQIPILNTSDIVGRTFLMPADENGKFLRARIVKAIDDQKEECEK